MLPHGEFSKVRPVNTVIKGLQAREIGWNPWCGTCVSMENLADFILRRCYIIAESRDLDLGSYLKENVSLETVLCN